jgi:putative membrane protein
MDQTLFLEYFIANTTGNSFLLQLILNAVALILATNFIRGVQVKSFISALVVALVLALLNATLGAFMDLISAPLRWLTLGLFAFIIDAIIIKVAAHFMSSFRVDGFISAVYLAVALSLFNLIISIFI